MLFGAKHPIGLIKLYFSPRAMCDFLDWEELAKVRSRDGSEAPARFSVNYGNELDITHAHARVNSLTFKDLQHLIIVDGKSEIVIAVSRVPSISSDEDLVFECTIVTPRLLPPFHLVKLFEHFSNLLVLHYGYARPLKRNYSPLTETRIQKSLFGSSIAVSKPDEGWIVDPTLVREGGIKGVYPVNYWNNAASRKFGQTGLSIPASVEVVGNVYIFNSLAQHKMQDKNPAKKSFLRFDEI